MYEQLCQVVGNPPDVSVNGEVAVTDSAAQGSALAARVVLVLPPLTALLLLPQDSPVWCKGDEAFLLAGQQRPVRKEESSGYSFGKFLGLGSV